LRHAGQERLEVDQVSSLEPVQVAFRSESLANVRPLRPIRVLLAGREARYLRAVTFLLGLRGYETRLSFKPASLLADVEAFRPDVVVLVEADSFGDVVGRAMALLGHHERLSVVVATSREDAPDSNRLRFVPKWGPFASLVDAVEGAWAELPSGRNRSEN
jgi:hypothetical protein